MQAWKHVMGCHVALGQSGLHERAPLTLERCLLSIPGGGQLRPNRRRRSERHKRQPPDGDKCEPRRVVKAPPKLRQQHRLSSARMTSADGIISSPDRGSVRVLFSSSSGEKHAGEQRAAGCRFAAPSFAPGLPHGDDQPPINTVHGIKCSQLLLFLTPCCCWFVSFFLLCKVCFFVCLLDFSSVSTKLYRTTSRLLVAWPTRVCA